ncbi:MAG: hypothetical protein KKA62_03200 [Nanoarchaeota archaeon]|nr:hypothetical protein [Nanoarchaeota archaeon]MBU1643737.1 hypothetical protein [Nanoarchaeota archaeon]MBU1976933.1 hypothetical protein [Nanoarchaeota archaeon]
MRFKKFLLISIIILSIFSVLAIADSAITINPIDNEITKKEQATFSLEIKNLESGKQKYNIYSLQSGIGWNVDPSPLKDKVIELGAGKSYVTTIVAHPLEDLPPGIYYVYLTIQGSLGEKYERALKIYLGPDGPVSYLPTIKATVDMDEKIDPNEPVSIKLFLENRNALNLTDLYVKIQSDIPEFVQEARVDLPPLEQKTLEFGIIPNSFQQPKDYTLFFVFEHAGETVKIIEKNINVIIILSDFSVEKTEEKVFLKSFETLTIKNDGNVENTQIVKVPVSLLGGLLSSSTGKVVSENGQRYLAWEVSLNPNETMTLNYVLNYRLLFYLLLTLLLFLGFYFYVQSPLGVSKTAVTTKSGDSGALSEIKITIEIKNHSKKPIKEVNIIDTVPGIGNVEKTLELGTLKPQEIKHTKMGTKVIWSLAELDAHEQRLITYKMKAKLNILGTFSLPRSVVEFKKRKNKTGRAYSNIFRISS